MIINSTRSESFSAMEAGRSVARRQLETSLGAVVMIAIVATAVVLGARSTSTAGEQVAKASVPVVVRSAVHVVPSERMQASTRADPRG